LPMNAPVSAAFSLAARRLAEQPLVFDFLPPKLTMLQQFAAKYSSGKLRTVGAAAAAIIAIILGLFVFQEAELIHLRSQWALMQTKVRDLTALQNKIMEYQPWYDTSFRILAILKQLTLAFPEDGSVTVKTIEIHNGNAVTCSGTASDNTAWLRTLAKLQTAEGLHNVTVEQIRGKSPMEITFDFQWGNGNGGAQ
ncbi:MAG TPA: hypothetical protein VMH30_00200, partial [Verrucomicrobiae bacterium]|nr:hypothetical protein [Verrucomicrobiae bacterium]